MITFFLADFDFKIRNYNKKKVLSPKKNVITRPNYFCRLVKSLCRIDQKKWGGKNFPEKQISENSFVSILSFWQSYNRVIWNILCEIVEMQKNAKSRVYLANFVRCILDFFDVFCNFFEKEGFTFVNWI